MKLSEFKGERAIEVIADLIAPITNIAIDNENLKLFRAEKHEGETDRDASIRDFKEKIPNLLKSHKKDVLNILCAMNDKKPDELSIADIVGGALELANDEDFVSLFLSVTSPKGQASPTESSAKREHSKPE